MYPDTSEFDRHIPFDDALRAIFSASSTLLRCTPDCPACQAKQAQRPNYPPLMLSSFGGGLLLNRLDASGVEVSYTDQGLGTWTTLTFNRADNSSVLVSQLDERIHLRTHDGHTVMVSLSRRSDLKVKDALKHPISFQDLCRDADIPLYVPKG